jgi:hypothetical protein
MTSKFNMRVDLAPYTPDPFLKDKIYQSMDKVDYTSYISANSTIFVFNIDCQNDATLFSYYNDPGYLLYGIRKAVGSGTYLYRLPSTFFFNDTLSITSLTQRLPYTVTSSSTVPTLPIKTLISQIGYDINFLNETFFYYAELECTDDALDRLVKKKVIYLFFSIKNLSSINYNDYNSTVYYEDKFRNVYIYPYIQIPTATIGGLNRNFNVLFNITDTRTVSNRFIESIDFDDREITKYYEKIDYKYMEREDYYTNKTNKMDLLKSLSKNYESFQDFYLSSLNEEDLMISSNEISMVYYNNINYEETNKNSYTSRNLNNLYINSNNSLSGKDKKFSFSLDNKLNYVKKYISDTGFRYNPYNSTILNVPSIYQLSKNYYINGYVDLTKYNSADTNNLLYTINAYLFKVLSLINPQIISLTYLTSPTVTLTINNLFSNSNNLTFGFANEKITLYFKGEPLLINTYYINKFKINFRFPIANNDFANYIIILGICFYNGKNINLLNYDITRNTDDLGYTLYTNQDCTLSLNSHIYNLNKRLKICQEKEVFLYDIKKSNYFLNYLSEDLQEETGNVNNFLLTNFYTFIPNFNRIRENTTNQVISNLQDITAIKINNFIKNLININSNYYVFKNNSFKSKTFMTYDFLYDLNLQNSTTNLVYNFTYLPKILQYEYLPLNIDKYKVYKRFPENIENIVTLPAGYYKVFRFTNYFPLNTFSTQSVENDKLVLTINTIDAFLLNNFCLLVKLPNGSFVEDKFFVDLQDTGKGGYYIDSNYIFNMASAQTEIYLAVSDSNGNIYQTTKNIIYAYKMFDQYNSTNGTNLLGSKYKIKSICYVSSYLNFYQFAFNFILFNDYVEKNSLLIDLQNISLEIHNTKYLKEIVNYDFKRFNYVTDLTKIGNQYNNYKIEITEKLGFSKRIVLIMNDIIENTIFIFNSNKIINLCRKIKNYLLLIKNYQLQKNINFDYLINFINYNASQCLELTFINYDLDTSYCINNYGIQDLFSKLITLSKNATLEEVIESIYQIEVTITYFQLKISLTIKNILEFMEQITVLNVENNNDIIGFINKINFIIENYTLNLVLVDSINLDIDKLDNSTLRSLLSTMFSSYTMLQIDILVTTIISYIRIIFYNTNKIDELINTLRLIYNDQSVDGIFPDFNNNVVKNSFIYNTTYYNSNLQINNFNFNKFLFDLATVITYLSDPLNSGVDASALYKKAISSGVLETISKAGDTFTELCQKIIGIYKYVSDINTGILPKYNIFNENNIGYMLYLLTLFKKYINDLNNIIISNDILLFLEFESIILYMNYFINSVTEYLYYVQLVMVFRQFNSFAIVGGTTYVPEDILKILSIDEIYILFKNIIETIFKLVEGSDQSLINNILQQDFESMSNIRLSSPDTEIKKMLDILKKFNYGNVSVYNLLKSYVLESYIVVKEVKDFSKIINKLEFQGDNIVVLQDFNILYDNFAFSSFNFDSDIIEIINYYNNYKLSSLNYYYQTPDIEFYKQAINYNFVKYTFINKLLPDI